MNDVVYEYVSQDYLLREQVLRFARDCEELAAMWQQLADEIREELE